MFAFTMLLNTQRLFHIRLATMETFIQLLQIPVCAAIFCDKASISSLLNWWAFFKNLR